MTDAPTPTKPSDLKVRFLSAIVMIAVAGGALWLGGWWWTAFVSLVALGVLWEWICLVRKFDTTPAWRGVWNAAAIGYVGLAVATLIVTRSGSGGMNTALGLVAIVVAVDVGAYFAGRAFGGPKIAPRISPSKTWSGLGGGALAAALAFAAVYHTGSFEWSFSNVGVALAGGAAFAAVAQAGDFFESWMKRRAGVKDSGNLLPGHGGLFDRADGLLAVCFVIGLLATIASISLLASGGNPLPTPA